MLQLTKNLRNASYFNTFKKIAVIIFVICLSSKSFSQENVVAEIEIRGLRRYDAETIRNKIKTKVGKPFSREALDEDIKRLYATNWFSNIIKKEEVTEKGIKITLVFTENDIISEIKFIGLKEFKKEDIIEELNVSPGNILNDYLLKLDSETILAKYHEKGYALAEISCKVNPEKLGVIVEFIIREGPRVKVDEIIIKGLKKLDEDDIRDVMKTDETSWLFTEYLNLKTLQEDIERIRWHCRSEGLLDVSAFIQDLEFSEDKKYVNIVIYVDEGEVYKLKDLTISGNTILTTEEIQKLMLLKPGDVLSMKNLEKDVQSIKSKYGEIAYIDADVTAKPIIAEEAGFIKLKIDINEGSKTKLGKIFVNREPPDKTKERVFLNELRVYPGEDLNAKQLRKSFERLNNKGYFESISFNLEKTEEENVKDLIIDAKETTTGTIRLGGGYSSNYGFIGMIDYVQKNFDIARFPKSIGDLIEGNAFQGAGQYFKISISPGKLRDRFYIDFREPYVYDYPIGAGFSIYSVNYTREFYNELRRGVSLSANRRFWDELLEVGLRFKFQETDVSSIEPGAPSVIRGISGSKKLVSMSTYFEYDKRDSIIIPSEGYLLGASFENAGGIWGGSFDFNKFSVYGAYYYTIYSSPGGGKHILETNLTTAWADEFGDSDDIPIYEKFFAGGVRSVRGYRFRTISPKENEEPIGGKYLLAGSIECSVPLYRVDVGDRSVDFLRGSVFFDFGNVSKDFGDFNWSDTRYSAGVGLKLIIPQLGNIPISVSLGFPINKQEDDESQVFQINIGYEF